jgi:hypothetical protein
VVQTGKARCGTAIARHGANLVHVYCADLQLYDMCMGTQSNGFLLHALG